MDLVVLWYSLVLLAAVSVGAGRSLGCMRGGSSVDSSVDRLVLTSLVYRWVMMTVVSLVCCGASCYLPLSLCLQGCMLGVLVLVVVPSFTVDQLYGRYYEPVALPLVAAMDTLVCREDWSS